ncbi:MAG: hypothetical protein JNK37_16535 [Verrucomicrobiales bacterium]|nr:hypothetical protein [Verrucomicrobiales bacterium]
MTSPAFSNRTAIVLLPVAALSLLATGCFEKEPAAPPKKAAGRVVALPDPSEITIGPDGLARRTGETEPYSGAVIGMDKGGKTLRYHAHYFAGKLHGPEMRYYEDGTLRRQYDYYHGEKVYHREWFENANYKRDATFVKGHAIGPHKTFFEDGRIRWSGTFGDNLLWEGHIIDYAEDGKLMWDAIFKKGKFVSGIYPESEQEKMIARGLVKPEDALYPIKPATPGAAPASAPAPAPEGGQPQPKAGGDEPAAPAPAPAAPKAP